MNHAMPCDKPDSKLTEKLALLKAKLKAREKPLN